MKITPSLGRTVLYCLTKDDVSNITLQNAQRVTMHESAFGPYTAPGCNLPVEGQEVPAIITAVFGNTPDSLVNLRLMIDGPLTPWVTSRHQAPLDDFGIVRPLAFHWRTPPYVPTPAPEGLTDAIGKAESFVAPEVVPITDPSQLIGAYIGDTEVIASLPPLVPEPGSVFPVSGDDPEGQPPSTPYPGDSISKSGESVEPPKTLIGTHAAAIIESVEQVVTQATETTPTEAPPKELDDDYRVPLATSED